ncbi:hypothetical protein ACFRKD_08270 [Streptomyces niveus]|uniref:hypothetical protein n=1 Tax=Streptomyces niveus TaxID=193462 RepID=UPI0036ABED35
MLEATEAWSTVVRRGLMNNAFALSGSQLPSPAGSSARQAREQPGTPVGAMFFRVS